MSVLEQIIITEETAKKAISDALKEKEELLVASRKKATDYALELAINRQEKIAAYQEIINKKIGEIETKHRQEMADLRAKMMLEVTANEEKCIDYLLKSVVNL